MEQFSFDVAAAAPGSTPVPEGAPSPRAPVSSTGRRPGGCHLGARATGAHPGAYPGRHQGAQVPTPADIADTAAAPPLSGEEEP